MRSYRLCILCPIIAAILVALAVLLTPPTAHAQANVSFMKDVAPILKENCFACHDAKKKKGKLDLTTFELLMKGGSRGEAVVPSKPTESFLWTLTAGTEEPKMPPKDLGGTLLPKEKVALIEKWIQQGAKFDGPSPQADLVVELRKSWSPPPPPAAYKFPSIVRSLVFTPDNQKLVIGGHHELLVWDVATGKLDRRVHTRAERANAMLYLPDGKTLVVAGSRPGQEGDVRLYNLDAPPARTEGEVKILNGVDAKAGVLIRELVQTDDEILCLALSPDGKKMASGGCDRIVRVWDLAADYKLEQTVENHADWVFGVAFTADSKRLLTCSRDKTAKVWDLTTKESVMTFPDHQNGVWGIAVKPDGKVGISCGEDGQIRFWNAGTDGKQIRAGGGHGKPVYKVAYHPTQPLVASCSADMTVKVTNVDSGQSVATFSGHTDYVFAVAISPDGKLVAAGAYNGEVRVWSLDTKMPVSAFNASPGIPLAAVPSK
jgi:WD40 repeat protein